jgi:3-hydroxyacyl-[acyl-carrier-protein] dehydratase
MAIIDNISLIEKNPHRFPMILVDRILEIGKYIVTEKFISINDPVFSSLSSDFLSARYPDYLVMESFFQSAGLFVNDISKFTPYIISTKNIDMKRSVRPGEIIRHELDVITRKENFVVVTGKTLVNESVVCIYGQVLVGFDSN